MVTDLGSISHSVQALGGRGAIYDKSTALEFFPFTSSKILKIEIYIFFLAFSNIHTPQALLTCNLEKMEQDAGELSSTRAEREVAPRYRLAKPEEDDLLSRILCNAFLPLWYVQN